MKYLSLFTGIGGFELGIQYATNNLRPIQPSISERAENQHDTSDELQQWECVGYSEIDKYAIQVYQSHFNHTNYGDITKIKAEDLPDFDFLCGGFPCQSFSIAGKRGGFADTRGTLFFDIARILKAKRPRLFLLENVKGLLSHDEGRTFGTIISTLDELGYDLQWEVLNSKNFGVPQNRERVFIVGNLRRTSRPKVFPITGESQDDTRITGTEVARSLDANYFKGVSPNGHQGSTRQLVQLNQPTHSNEPSFTLTSQDKHGISDGIKIRRLTPKECERLQGFPDDWTACVSDSQRYKCCGNAVTVNVIQAIMERLL
mgnify:CR=1 FL=1